MPVIDCHSHALPNLEQYAAQLPKELRNIIGDKVPVLQDMAKTVLDRLPVDVPQIPVRPARLAELRKNGVGNFLKGIEYLSSFSIAPHTLLQGTVSELLRSMDRAGIDRSVLIAAPPIASNRWVLQTARDNPDKIIPVCHVPTLPAETGPIKWRQSFEALVRQGARGFKIHPNFSPYPAHHICHEALFETAGPFFPLGHRLLFANLWLFEPILLNQLTGKTGTNALVRTTGATTLINGGIKENVLPTEARALVNFRLLPGDSLETVVAHVTEAIDDPSVSVRSRGGQEASSVSCHRCPAYQRIATTIRQVFPDVLVAPSITVGATDARYYTSVSSRVYRFAPQHIGPEDRSRFHGINERIKVDHFADAVRFYRQLVINVNSPSP